MPRGTAWVVGSGTGECDHPAARIEHVGDDGRNAYFECTRCGAVLVSRIDEIIARRSTR